MWRSDTRVEFEIQLPDYLTPFRFNLLALESHRRARARFFTFPAGIPDLEEEILRACLVSPIWFLDQMGSSKAFTVTTLVNLIMLLSGTPDDPEAANYQLNLERASIQSDVTQQMLISICRAFPGYDPETVEQMSWGSLCRYYALAEHLLLQIGGIEQPLQFTPPGEPEQARKGARRKLDTRQGETMISRDTPINFEAESLKLSKDMGYSAHDEPEIQQHKQNMLEYAQKLLAEKQRGR